MKLLLKVNKMGMEKETGSYYTPYELVEFMVKYLKKKNQDFTNVLEPSVGDGRFLSALLKISHRIDAIELFEEKVRDVKKRYQNANLGVMQQDFLQYVIKTKKKYSLIIGNPPYISPKVMDKEKIELAKNLCTLSGLSESIMQNMWLAFVVGATRLLEPNGSIFFVLPMEFLQVQYAERLRTFLESKFNTIHIVSFQKQIFPEIEQEVCLVYLTNKKRAIPYISYEVYQDALSERALFVNRIKKSKPLKKWSNAILSDEDIILLKSLSGKYKKISEVGVSAPGIVTGGNKYFILTNENAEAYNCIEYTLPILQKSSYISENTIVVDHAIMSNLREQKKPAHLLNLSHIQLEDMTEELKQYLAIIKPKLIKRFKCANRKPWYGVPIVNKGDVIFFKRYHILPRIYINRAEVHTTDAGYHIRLNEMWDKDSLVFCFYNSLTLAQCEFQGRYYGGGVSELVPSEFKELPIPYYKIKQEDVEHLDQMFRDKKSSNEIVAFVNSRTIALDMSETEIGRIEGIRRKLIQRRFRD